VGAVLEAIHRDRDFVTACQNQARRQRGVHNDGWGEVWGTPWVDTTST
jgi:hypothetical protein